jgi:hypothetical protein
MTLVDDPKGCRANAQRCIEIANNSKDTKTSVDRRTGLRPRAVPGSSPGSVRG